MRSSYARALLFLPVVLIPALPAQAVNWTNQGYGPGIAGFNPRETTISANNAQNLILAWQSTTSDINGVYAMVEDHGVVFVLSHDAGGNYDLVALKASTGAELWKALTGFPQNFVGPTGLAAGAGLVFTSCGNNPTNTVEGPCAYSRKTGASVWFDNFVEQNVTGIGSISRPTYSGGVVYLSHNMCANGDSGACDSFYAISATTGAILWGSQATAAEFDQNMNQNGSAAVAGGIMYVPCAYQFDGNFFEAFGGLCTFAGSNGSFGWEYGSVNANGQNPYANAAVSVSGKTVFFQTANNNEGVDSNDTLTAIDAGTGNARWSFDSVFGFHDGVPPTVANGAVYWPDANGTLWALKEKTGATLWSTSNWGQFCSPVNGPNGTESQPQVVDGVVFITTACQQGGSNYVTNFAVAANNGNVLWQDAEGFNTIPISASGAAPVIVNGELYADCVNVCAYSLPKGTSHRPNPR